MSSRPEAALWVIRALAAACVTWLWLPAAAFAAEPPASKLAGFEPWLGKWEFTAEFLAQNEWAKDFYAESLEWGPRRNTVRMRETTHKSDSNRMVFEGFAFWHPTEDKLCYTGYNVQERFLFEGEIVTLTSALLVKEYRVHYPPGYPHAAHKELVGDVREYREERRLVDANTMELSIWIRISGKWERWPAADARPFVTKRASRSL